MTSMYSEGLKQVSTKREKVKAPTVEGIPKPYPEDAPARLHKEYYDEYVKPKITGSEKVDSAIFGLAKYLEGRGVNLPKTLQDKSFSEYLDERGVKVGKRAGGTRMPKKHIMELPTNSAQKRRK